jgi:organic hydroperoxide reductase OsmC/OhrA
MNKVHHYQLSLNWTGNLGNGTNHYRAYERAFTINAENKPTIYGSADPTFLGDEQKYNPEEYFLAALSSCHMLWFLHLCADKGIHVISYEDSPEGFMEEKKDGSGAFTKVCLKPQVFIKNEEHLYILDELHEKANGLCFIANSVNFKVLHEPKGFVENKF